MLEYASTKVSSSTEASVVSASCCFNKERERLVSWEYGLKLGSSRLKLLILRLFGGSGGPPKPVKTARMSVLTTQQRDRERADQRIKKGKTGNR